MRKKIIVFFFLCTISMLSVLPIHAQRAKRIAGGMKSRYETAEQRKRIKYVLIGIGVLVLLSAAVPIGMKIRKDIKKKKKDDNYY